MCKEQHARRLTGRSRPVDMLELRVARAGLAVNFVKLDDLTEDERRIMVEAGRKGAVITRDRHVEEADLNRMRPTRVAARVEEQLPFWFHACREHVEMWKRLGIRPVKGSDNPYGAVARYCSYNEAFDQYVYTQAWIRKIVREAGTVEKYRAFFGREPRMKTGGHRIKGCVVDVSLNGGLQVFSHYLHR
ncbi:hypothetical protein ACF1G0_18010 [Streptomyces sp. NPDC013953]|uniref:hypothetical protein n=1 Tax=Streptomyces sp. NPDC013953 TaxID=3364868 RepID=UPI003700C056